MEADGPYAERCRAELPHLLRHPQHPLMHTGVEKETIADNGNTEFLQHQQGVLVEAVRWRHERLRTDAVGVEDLHRPQQFLALPLERQSSKLTPGVDAQQSGVCRLVKVLVAVHGDAPASRLFFAHPYPEIRARRLNLQLGVSVVRHYRQDRLNPARMKHFLDRCPQAPVHGRTDIVKPHQIPCVHSHFAFRKKIRSVAGSSYSTSSRSSGYFRSNCAIRPRGGCGCPILMPVCSFSHVRKRFPTDSCSRRNSELFASI